MENLALKYRPQVFDDLLGQDSVSKTLLNSIKSNKIHHSYLFYGPRGCGKTSTARILAKSLNCHSPQNHNPCNKCISCREIASSNSIDVIEIDAASYTQVQNIRDVIIDNVNLSPSRDKYKIYILDEVHMLSTSAFNALLKTIEEPPEHAVFIMATTEIHKVPLTIVSRCQTFRFKTIKPQMMIEALCKICDKEKIKYDIKAIELLVNLSGGAMRDSLGILEKVSSFSQNNITFESVSQILGYPSKELLDLLTISVLERDIKSVHLAFEKINEESLDVISVLRELRDYYSKSFLAAQGIIKMDYIEGYNPFIFAKLSRKINKIIDEIRYSDNVALLAETFIYTLMDTTIDMEQIIKKLEFNSNLEVSIKEKDVMDKPLPAADDSGSFSNTWKKVLNAVSKESSLVYNMLLSSDVKIENNKISILTGNNLEFDMITKNKNIIEKNIFEFSKNNFQIEIGIKKKIEPEITGDFKKEEKTLEGFKLIDIDNGEEVFPELEKIKKVFGNDIIKINKGK